MDEERLIAWGLRLALQMIRRRGRFTHRELREEMVDIGLIDDATVRSWMYEIDRRGHFTRVPGTANDMAPTSKTPSEA